MLIKIIFKNSFKMKNILFIHQSAELYGSDKTLLLLLKNLDATKFRAVIILPNDGELKTELEKYDIKVVIAPVLKLYRKMFTPKNIFQFLKDIKTSFRTLDVLHNEYRFDLVYSNTLAVLLGVFYSKKRNIKHLWHVHEIIVHPQVIATLYPQILLKHSDKVVCNSFATKTNLISRCQLLESKTAVIHNGIEHELLNNELSLKKSFGFQNHDIVITLVGRISRLKGHKLLLTAFLKYLKPIQNVKLLFVGSPVTGQEYYLHEVEKMIQENSLQEYVKIIPFIKNLQPIWHITDIAVMPSTEAESFGLVAAEAMLAQKPVVAANHGGLTEIVVDNKTGFLVEPNNEKALADALLLLIKSPEMRCKMGNAGFNVASDKFTIQKYVAAFEDVFSKMLS